MKTPLNVSSRYELVAEANRRMYNDESYADDYVRSVLSGPADQARLREDLEEAIGHLKGARPILALDCCGGAGNAALLLHELGCDVELVDISPVMIERYRRECRRRGYEGPAQCSEIAAFFAQSTRRYDLMVFSSCLHHLENPVMVLTMAHGVLKPGGLIVTFQDPVRVPGWKRPLLEFARLADTAVTHPRQVLTRGWPVLKRILRGGSAYKQAPGDLELKADNYGNLAEFHADTGFDEAALIAELENRTGFRVLFHKRYRESTGALRSLALKVLRSPTAFRLLLQRETGDSPGGTASDREGPLTNPEPGH
jgi:SAM-dependent methyltransferase